MEALEFESRFQNTPIGTMCLECGANSVDSETRFIDEFTIVEEVTCRFWCSIDGQPEYFKTKQEMYMFACGECRELIQITDENERELRESGAFDADYCDE